MRNAEVAQVLYDIADLLELKGEDRFRPIAYRRAAREIEAMAEDIEKAWRQGGIARLRQIQGVGEAIAEKVDQYLREGKVDALEELRKEFPKGIVEVMRLRGLGPKRAAILWKSLGITDINDLKRAAENRQIRRLKGFGEKTEQRILEAIKLHEEGQSRTLLAVAWPIAEEILEYLKKNAPIDQASIAGSARRMRETVGDLDLLVTSTDPAEAMRAFTSMPIVKEVVLAGDTKSTVILKARMQVDIRVLEPESWGAGLVYFTGNKDHNIHLRTMAQERGWKLDEYGIFEGKRKIAGKTEEEVYGAFGLPWIPPEIREENGEIEAAAKGELPRLVALDDIRGDFHVHTNRSDGVDTLEAMVHAAAARGYEYVGISDHSPAVVVANGLDPEALRMHRAAIRALNRDLEGKITVLAGTECDILDAGALDYPDAVLRELDYVVVSVHSKFTLPEDEQTERVIRALKNPYVNIYAHPTTRLIGNRDPIEIDLEAVMEAAASSGTALEVNAYPNRMDLNGAHARMAKEKGCVLAVDTDSHSRGHLENMRFGVGTARRGWLEAKDVVNAWPLDRVRGFFR
ncbi:MAG: DNA polymerase/3'-5' exonuclease PolX [Methanobacteriota archaeon]|nr:MAG: DNA polymerase/3'-5' exonuclease PolX [Euryarchaeota archaeon]